jgi:hypothetical protein
VICLFQLNVAKMICESDLLDLTRHHIRLATLFLLNILKKEMREKKSGRNTKGLHLVYIEFIIEVYRIL